MKGFKNNQILVVLHQDGTFGFFRYPENVENRDFNKNSKFFAVHNNISVDRVCYWISRGFNDPEFIELERGDIYELKGV